MDDRCGGAGKDALCQKPFTMTAAEARAELDFGGVPALVRASMADGVPRMSTVAGRTTYDHQLDAVLTALREGTALPTEGDDPIRNMAVIDAVYAAAGFERAWS